MRYRDPALLRPRRPSPLVTDYARLQTVLTPRPAPPPPPPPSLSPPPSSALPPSPPPPPPPPARRASISSRAARAHADLPRGEIIGDQTGFLKLLFRREDMRLLGVHVIGEQATELVHIGLIAMLAEVGAELFNRACFNYPTLGDLYKYAAYDALAQRGALR